MRWLDAARARLRLLFARRAAEERMEEEIRFHLEMEAERLARDEGLDPREAHRRARVAFGGAEQVREELRAGRGLAWLPGWWLDVKLGLRMLARSPGLTLVGGLGMAVGTAVCVGFFTFIATAMFPTLPLHQGERIVALENRDQAVNNEERRALHDVAAWRQELRTVEDLGAFRSAGRNLFTGEGPPEPVKVAEMTASGFRVARVPPLLGRYLLPGDEVPGARPVLVIGHGVWRERFGADPAVVGRDVRLGRRVHTVVGVMPEGFAFPMDHEYWLPLRADATAYGPREGPEVFVFGRLAPGATMAEAQAELDAVGRRAAAAFPETHAQLRPMVMPYVHSLTDIQGITLWQVSQMQLMVTLLLVVVSLNVAVLVYARTARRQGEIAVRSALGAGRGRIVAQLFAEALVLSVLASAVGLGLAHFGATQGYRILEAELGIPFWMDYSLGSGTVLYTVGLTLLAAVIVGVLPALQATGRRLQGDLRQLGGGTGMRLGKVWTALIVAQVALAVAVLPAAVHLAWSEIRFGTTRTRLPAEETLVVGMRTEPDAPEAAGASGDDEALGPRLPELMRRLREEPAVAAVTFTAATGGETVQVEGAAPPAESPAGHRVQAMGVDPGFFGAMGVRLLAGRALQPRDADGEAPPVVVSRTFVARVLGGGSAVGRRVRLVDAEEGAAAGAAAPAPWHEVVGVVEDLEANPLDPAQVRPWVFRPVDPARTAVATLAVRLRAGTPADFGPTLRRTAAAVDPSLRVGTIRTLADGERQERIAMRLVAVAVGLVLLSVLLLSAAGIYALVSFTVTQRRREIGIRTALGAHPRQVLRGVFARAARQVALGMGLGAAVALGLEVASDGGVMGGNGAVLLPAIAAMMAGAALVAAFGPARRGLRIQPMEALRAE